MCLLCCLFWGLCLGFVASHCVLFLVCALGVELLLFFVTMRVYVLFVCALLFGSLNDVLVFECVFL